MFNPNEFSAHATARRQDLLRAADEARLAQEAAQSNDSHPFYAATLARVGTLLVGVGSDLQNRYGEVCREIGDMPATISDPSIQLAR